ncbi:MAG: hypothetical protein II122_02705, partial [Bacteroidaceae bacterium]|nr:hypothetical protein [Bacteroidaceae bacterium]
MKLRAINLYFSCLLMAVAVMMNISCSDNDDNADGSKLVLSEYDMNRPVGFGADVTGGEGLNVVTVTSAKELTEAVSGTQAATVYVKGTISLDSTILVGSNKSIIGLPGATVSNLNRNERSGIFL